MSEPRQILESGLASPEQFHGIEIDEETHARNDEANASTFGGRLHLHQGDFVRVLDRLIARNDFRPAIINFDTVQTPACAIDDVERILWRVNRTALGGVLLVWHTLEGHGYYKDIGDTDLSRTMGNHRECLLRLAEGSWRPSDRSYVYAGAGRATTMQAVTFWRPPLSARRRSSKNIDFTPSASLS